MHWAIGEGSDKRWYIIELDLILRLFKQSSHPNQHQSKGGFPLSRNFYLRTQLELTWVNKIKAMYDGLGENVRVERVQLLSLRETYP